MLLKLYLITPTLTEISTFRYSIIYNCHRGSSREVVTKCGPQKLAFIECYITPHDIFVEEYCDLWIKPYTHLTMVTIFSESFSEYSNAVNMINLLVPIIIYPVICVLGVTESRIIVYINENNVIIFITKSRMCYFFLQKIVSSNPLILKFTKDFLKIVNNFWTNDRNFTRFRHKVYHDFLHHFWK